MYGDALLGRCMLKARGGITKSVAELLLGHQVNDIRAVRYGLYALYTFGSGDYRPKDVAATMRVLAGGALRTIKGGLDAINKLDDDLDLLSPEQIVGLGDVALGVKPSAVLSAPVVAESLGKSAEALERKGVMSRDDLVSFSNLALHFIIEEAKQAETYAQTGDPAARAALVEAHMRQTEVTGVFVMHMFKRDKKITQHIRDGGILDYAFLQELYPNLFRMCRLTQYKDDILDIYKDTIGERQSGRAMPSVVMLASDHAGKLYVREGDINPDFRRLSDLNMATETRIPVEHLPQAVREAIGSVEGEYQALAKTFSGVMRGLLLADIKHVLKDGIYITKDRDVTDTERKWHEGFIPRRTLSERFNAMTRDVRGTKRPGRPGGRRKGRGPAR